MKSKVNKREDKKGLDCFVVGIGASAGGLEAFRELLKFLPEDTGSGFVFVQHLDPNHKSLTSKILTNSTRMPVHLVEGDIAIESNQVFIIPANHDLAISNGVLKLLPRKAMVHGVQTVIDSFFKSLALDQRCNAIGIILSGTASDGTSGIKEIKHAGGITFAQDPITASFDGMPNNAIASGFVDFVLSPKEIAKELTRVTKGFSRPKAVEKKDFLIETSKSQINDKNVEEYLKDEGYLKVFDLLKKFSHVNFGEYKFTTIQRRVQRRMVICRAETIDDYIQHLEKDQDELKSLFKDILINVTEFFRDTKAFEELQNRVFHRLIEFRHENKPIRIWIPGCSSGEEAYSLAILWAEFMNSGDVQVPLQIFASDLSDDAIQIARKGRYPLSISAVVSKERLKSFFDKVDDGYMVKKFIRDTCLFSKHDIINDPPFSKIDLISCRNLLIYFGPELQSKVIPLFHYALNPNGFLFLGKSEGIGNNLNLFDSLDKSNKIFAKKSDPSVTHLDTPFIPRTSYNLNDSGTLASTLVRNGFESESDRLIISRYAPPSITINSNLEILQYRGRTTPYLEPASGPPSNNLLKMARPELIEGLHRTIKLSFETNMAERIEGLCFEVDDLTRSVSIEVVPVASPTFSAENNYLVFFEEVPRTKIKIDNELKPPGSESKSTIKDKLIQLELELKSSRDFQHALIEEYEATQEELTSTVEEAQSANEELQSSNEELETSKEELQSTNEELNTVNDELQVRNIELVTLSGDLNNVLTSSEIPIVIVGTDCRIRRYTHQAESYFNLINSDIGRPLSDIRPKFELDIDSIVSNVIRSSKPWHSEVKIKGDGWMRLQVKPYMTNERKVDGALISLVDITKMRDQLTEAKMTLANTISVANTLTLPLVVLDKNLCLLSANKGFSDMFKINSEKLVGGDIGDILGGAEWDSGVLRHKLTDVILGTESIVNLEVKAKFEVLGDRVLLLNAKRIDWQTQMPNALLLSIDDITLRKGLEVSLAKANKSKDLFLATLSHELRTPLSTILSWAQLIQKKNFDLNKLEQGLQAIELSAKAQGQLIDDLLDISRIQSGKLSVKFSEVELENPVKLTVEAIHPLAAKKAIDIECTVSGKLNSVWCDPDRIRQVVWNLLSNAIKFSPQNSSIKILVTEEEYKEKNFVSIKVVDQGVGIENESILKLFDHFYQVDSLSTRSEGGLGLGLAIVSSIIRMHGGQVFAKSEGSGKGSEFKVLLPFKSESPLLALKEPTFKKKSEQQNLSKVELGEINSPDLSRLSVIIVEDNSSTREVLNEAISYLKAKVTACSSVKEALIEFDNSVPDVLVSDIAMPDEDGFELIFKIRNLSTAEGGEVPALALSAYATKQDIEKIISSGFNSHLAKPFDYLELGQEILRLASLLKK